MTGTPVYSRENLFENLGTPVKSCLKVTGTPVKTCWNLGSRNHFRSDLLRPRDACNIAPSYVWHDSSICVPWLIRMCAMIHAMCAIVSWMLTLIRIINVRDLTQSHPRYVWHDAFMPHICMSHVTHMSDHVTRTNESCCTYAWVMSYYMTPRYVWHDSFVCATWLIHMYDMTHSYACDMTHSYVWHNSSICVPLCRRYRAYKS